ncbi:MAG: hypothetical protein A3J76_01420 [Candidatus Moranbacteria bacterium RBG_13_45_13]|nr:MAG: hypothetical protein A3J76_01420 [Candidatus Moranbacteria bacterium RBG_13_45_13]
MKRSFICIVRGISEEDVSRGGTRAFKEELKKKISEIVHILFKEVRVYMSQDVRFMDEPDGIFCEIIVPKFSTTPPEQLEEILEKHFGPNSQVYAHY